MSDPREILDTFYRETMHLPESAVKDLANRELAEVSAYHVTERLANITVPVQMLLGTGSPAYLRAATAAVAARIPGATIVAMRGQGHQAIDYDPQQFVRAVVDFDAHKILESAPLRPRLPEP
jgi:pimeloyl-ACP methyl ester carboxylesterase